MYSIITPKAKASVRRPQPFGLALALAGLVFAGCLGGDPNAAGSPESAARELFHSLLSGDPGVTSYLSAASNKQLDAAAVVVVPALVEVQPSPEFLDGLGLLFDGVGAHGQASRVEKNLKKVLALRLIAPYYSIHGQQASGPPAPPGSSGRR